MSESNPVGRPSKYEARFPKMAAKACELGATHQDLADLFDVSIDTVTTWIKEHPKFSASIKEAKLRADEQVEKSLFKRALGYSHEDVDIRTVAIGNGQSEIVKTPLTKHYPPSEVACIFWLKNRKPKEWRDKQDVALQNADGSNLLSPEILAAAANIAKGK